MPKSADLPWPAPLCESVCESVHQQYMIESTQEEEGEEEEKVGFGVLSTFMPTSESEISDILYLTVPRHFTRTSIVNISIFRIG